MVTSNMDPSIVNFIKVLFQLMNRSQLSTFTCTKEGVCIERTKEGVCIERTKEGGVQSPRTHFLNVDCMRKPLRQASPRYEAP